MGLMPKHEWGLVGKDILQVVEQTARNKNNDIYLISQ